MDDLTSKVTTYEETTVDKHSVSRLELKIRELEAKLELEQTMRQRAEVSGAHADITKTVVLFVFVLQFQTVLINYLIIVVI